MTGFITTWREAEDNAVQWMREHGWPDAQPTTGGADGGIDVRSYAGLAQVKFEAHQVGRPAIQRLVGARGHGTEDLLFFTGSGYSKAAREYADDLGVALFTYDLTGLVSAFNDEAHHVLTLGSAATAGQPFSVSTHPRALPQTSSAREKWGMGFGLLGLLIIINTGVQTFRAIVGDGMKTWDWYDPLWTLPIGFGFAWIGMKLFQHGRSHG